MRLKRTRSASGNPSEFYARAKRSKADSGQITQSDNVLAQEALPDRDMSPAAHVDEDSPQAQATTLLPGNQAESYSEQTEQGLAGIESIRAFVSKPQAQHTNPVETSTPEPMLTSTTEPSQQYSEILIPDPQQPPASSGTQTQQAREVHGFQANADLHRFLEQMQTSSTEPTQQSSEPPVSSETHQAQRQLASRAQEFPAKADQHRQAQPSWMVQEVSVSNKCKRFQKELSIDENRLTMRWETAQSIERVRSLASGTIVMMNDTHIGDSK